MYKTNNEFLLLASLPWMNINGFKNLNCPIAKSAVLAAYCPSFPRIPTPTCAYSIILTSLAPSPIARVTFLGNLFLIILTISAFYYGDTLQANTTSTLSEQFKKVSLISSYLSITLNDTPATIIAYF